MTDTVSLEWVADRDGKVRLVDVREAWEFDSIGHLPGAVNVPFDRFRDEGGDDVGMLPGPAAFADLLGGAGLSRDDTLVAYDDTNGVFAARLLVTARVYGFDGVRLLNGDLSAWRREHEVATEPTRLDPVDVEPRRVEGSDSPIVGIDRVRAATDGGAVLLDTRDPDEYAAGHLRGAIQFDWTEAVDPGTRGVKPRAELETLFADRGVTPDRRVVLYCNTARRLSHTYAVLRWLGFEDVGIYEGSLTEWRRVGGDLVEGSEPG